MDSFTLTPITQDELEALLSERKDGVLIDITNRSIEGMNLAGRDLSGVSFSYSIFRDCNLEQADFDGDNLHCTGFIDCIMKNVKLTNCDITEANLGYLDLSGADISGSNMYRSILEYSNLEGVKDDDRTQFYRLLPPAEGPFIAWKCCTEWRVVQLLVPADAKRVSATAETCRCSKAKVLSIKSIDETQSYTWAQSTVDQDFYYEVGKWAIPANGFCEDRWRDSSEGIHFFMERQQCVDYQTK